MKPYWCALFLAACAIPPVAADGVRATYHIDTVAGSGRIGDGGPATAAQFLTISGIAVDRLGNLYISDTGNHRVRRVSATGVVSTIAGTGIAGFSGDGGLAVNAQVNFPYGLALDSLGNLYVADFGNQRVRRIGNDGLITTVAGTGRKASSPDGLAPTETSLLSPRNVAVDAKGILYIAEFEGHRVRRLTPAGKLTTIAGTGMAGLSGDGFPASAAQLSFPAGLAFDRAGALYIADSGNNLVRKIYADGIIGTVLGRQGTTLFTPLGIAVDGAGTIYAGDSTFRVTAYTTAGKWLAFAGSGVPGFSGDGGQAKDAALDSVNDLAVDVNGNVYIADGVRVRRVAGSGAIETVAGDGYVHAVGDGASATAALLHQPSAIALDANGNLYIGDTGTQRVRQVTPDGLMNTLAGTGLASRDRGDQVPAASAPLNGPMAVAVDGGGNVVVADAFNHRVVAINAVHTLRPVAGTGTGGAGADGLPPLLTALRAPRGVCLDRAGTLYIVDTSNHRVVRVPAGGTVQTVAGNGSGGYAGDGGAARLAQLRVPNACAFDGKGNLFIADTGNHCIRRVSASGTISTVAGSGVTGGSGDEGPAVSARLASPRAVMVDDGGNLYVGDTGNNRIRQVTPDGVIHTIAGTGPAGFGGDGGPAMEAMLDGPAGLFLDGSGALYFADSNNNRIRRLTPDVTAPPPVTMTPAIAVVNAISLRRGAIAPGEIVSIFGSGLGPETGVTAGLGTDGALPTVLEGVEVRMNSTAAPIFYAQGGQVNAQAPYSILGSDVVTVQVMYRGKVVGGAEVAGAASAPALVPLAINQDGAPNAESAAAARGSWMTFYGTGEGMRDGIPVAGVPAQAPFAHPLLPVALKIAGVTAEILYAGSAPGMVGVMQINARVPAGFVAPGAAQVELTVGDAAAPATTIWLR